MKTGCSPAEPPTAPTSAGLRGANTKELLTGLGTRTIALTHESFDALPASRSVEYLREMLIHHGMFPDRDRQLSAFERWLAIRIHDLAGTPHIQAPIERFARWHHLKRLRQMAGPGKSLNTAVRSAKQEITKTEKFLTKIAALKCGDLEALPEGLHLGLGNVQVLVPAQIAPHVLGTRGGPMTSATNDQQEICKRFSVTPIAASQDMKVGISRNVRDGMHPINGLRHSPAGDATGWYIWAGEELSDDPDIFVPVHVSQTSDWCPQVTSCLALPPGWRFLPAHGHEDVWFDSSIVHP